MKLRFYPGERVGIFIDGANLYAASKSLGFDIDYRKLLKAFQKRGYLLRAYYYTALIEDQEYSSIRPLIDWLDYNGYKVVTKPAKEFTDSMGRRKIKGNMDIELAIDAMEQLSESTNAKVIITGNQHGMPFLIDPTTDHGTNTVVTPFVKGLEPSTDVPSTPSNPR